MDEWLTQYPLLHDILEQPAPRDALWMDRYPGLRRFLQTSEESLEDVYQASADVLLSEGSVLAEAPAAARPGETLLSLGILGCLVIALVCLCVGSVTGALVELAGCVMCATLFYRWGYDRAGEAGRHGPHPQCPLHQARPTQEGDAS